MRHKKVLNMQLEQATKPSSNTEAALFELQPFLFSYSCLK